MWHAAALVLVAGQWSIDIYAYIYLLAAAGRSARTSSVVRGRACESTANAHSRDSASAARAKVRRLRATSRQCAGRAREGTINARTSRQCAGRTLEGTVARGRTFAVAARTDAAEPARGYGRLDCTRQRGRAACNPKLAS